MLLGFDEPSRDGRDPIRDDVESPRRRLESVFEKSDAVEPDFTCEALVGVRGGVCAPPLGILLGSEEHIVDD